MQGTVTEKILKRSIYVRKVWDSKATFRTNLIKLFNFARNSRNNWTFRKLVAPAATTNCMVRRVSKRTTRRASGKFVWIGLAVLSWYREIVHMRLTIAYVCMRTPCCRVLVTRGRSRLCQGPLAYILIDKAMEVACPTSPDARGRLSSSHTKLFRAFVEYSGLKILTFRNEDFQDRQCLYRLPCRSQGIPLLSLLLPLFFSDIY